MPYIMSAGKAGAQVSDSHQRQSERIVQSARKCFEEDGVRKTTLASIAREAGITRELIYYYFSGKSDILAHVHDSFVQDAVETAQLWCETWASSEACANGEFSREMMLDAVASLRRFVFDGSGRRRPMSAVLDETGDKCPVVHRMIDSAFFSISSSELAFVLDALFPAVKKEDQVLAFTLLLEGLAALMELNGRLSDEQIYSLCAGMISIGR